MPDWICKKFFNLENERRNVVGHCGQQKEEIKKMRQVDSAILIDMILNQKLRRKEHFKTAMTVALEVLKPYTAKYIYLTVARGSSRANVYQTERVPSRLPKKTG